MMYKIPAKQSVPPISQLRPLPNDIEQQNSTPKIKVIEDTTIVRGLLFVKLFGNIK